MSQFSKAVISVAMCFAAGGIAMADDLPASGTYQCSGAGGVMADLKFTVGPGNIYTTKKGFRGVMTIHPGTGNVLFHGAPPHNDYQGRYSAGPPPQVVLVTMKDGVGSDVGIICRLTP